MDTLAAEGQARPAFEGRGVSGSATFARLAGHSTAGPRVPRAVWSATVSRDSRVWFTLSHGILNEIYYPRVDNACTRDLGFIVTDGESYFSERKAGIPAPRRRPLVRRSAYRIHNTARDGRYRIEKEVLTDPWRDVVLQRVRFVPLQGTLDDFRLYVMLAPHLANHGAGNTAWVGDYKGTPMLLAERDNYALALASTAPWLSRSVGFVGFSDGWQQLQAHKRLRETYARAENGNVAVTGEVDLRSSDGAFVMALGFGPTAMEAGQHALISLLEDFDGTRREYVRAWKAWQATLKNGLPPKARSQLFHTSAAVLRTHESKRVEGGIIASLSIPWGFSKPDDDLGGYHLVWPRDLVETAGGFIAMGAHQEVRRVLRYLQVTQEPDGHWSQNMWLDGTPYWHGVQMDETALPILLVDLAVREGCIDPRGRDALWPMVRRAAAFVARHGPVSPQDRWEKSQGMRRSRSRPKSRRCSSRPIWPMHKRTRPPRITCARRPMRGMPASNGGCTCRERRWRWSTKSTGITSASQSPIGPMPRRRVRASSRSRTGRRINPRGRRRRRSASTRWRSCASGCARRTTRAS